MFVTVTNFYKTREEQMRMSLILTAKNKDAACDKAAALLNPKYKLVGYERWFNPDATAREMSQAVYHLEEPIDGYQSELKVAAWTKK